MRKETLSLWEKYNWQNINFIHNINMKTPNLRTDEWVNIWFAQKSQIEANLVGNGYKLLSTRTANEVCEKVVFVLNPELAVVTARKLGVVTPPRLILVKWGIVPAHNMSVVNSASPHYQPDIDGINPFQDKKTNITHMGTIGDWLQVLWIKYYEGNMSERWMWQADGTAYYK